MQNTYSCELAPKEKDGEAGWLWQLGRVGKLSQKEMAEWSEEGGCLFFINQIHLNTIDFR
jgi:hypothetical protein